MPPKSRPEKKSARLRANVDTQAERDTAQAAMLALPLPVQKDRADVLAITQSQRVFAVGSLWKKRSNLRLMVKLSFGTRSLWVFLVLLSS